MRSIARLPRLAALCAVLVSAGVLMAPAASAATVTGAGEADLLGRLNAARHDSGRATLTESADLVALARRWSATMAANGDISHNPNLTSDVANWQVVGENVGMGPDVARVHDAFMASAHHRDNILDSRYTEVGLGTVTDNRGEVFVTEVFRRPITTVAQVPVPPTRATSPMPPAGAPPQILPAPAAVGVPTSAGSAARLGGLPAARPAVTVETLVKRLHLAARLPRPTDTVQHTFSYADVLSTLTR